MRAWTTADGLVGDGVKDILEDELGESLGQHRARALAARGRRVPAGSRAASPTSRWPTACRARSSVRRRVQEPFGRDVLRRAEGLQPLLRLAHPAQPAAARRPADRAASLQQAGRRRCSRLAAHQGHARAARADALLQAVGRDVRVRRAQLRPAQEEPVQVPARADRERVERGDAAEHRQLHARARQLRLQGEGRQQRRGLEREGDRAADQGDAARGIGTGGPTTFYADHRSRRVSSSGIAGASRQMAERHRELEREVAERTSELAASAESLRAQGQALSKENEERRRAEEEARRAAEEIAALEPRARGEPEGARARGGRAQEGGGGGGARAGPAPRAHGQHARPHLLQGQGVALHPHQPGAGGGARRRRAPRRLIGRSDLDFFPPEFAHVTLEDERRLFRTGEPVLGQARARRAERALVPDHQGAAARRDGDDHRARRRLEGPDGDQAGRGEARARPRGVPGDRERRLAGRPDAARAGRPGGPGPDRVRLQRHARLLLRDPGRRARHDPRRSPRARPRSWPPRRRSPRAPSTAPTR